MSRSLLLIPLREAYPNVHWANPSVDSDPWKHGTNFNSLRCSVILESQAVRAPFSARGHQIHGAVCKDTPSPFARRTLHFFVWSLFHLGEFHHSRGTGGLCRGIALGLHAGARVAHVAPGRSSMPKMRMIGLLLGRAQVPSAALLWNKPSPSELDGFFGWFYMALPC